MDEAGAVTPQTSCTSCTSCASLSKAVVGAAVIYFSAGGISRPYAKAVSVALAPSFMPGEAFSE